MTELEQYDEERVYVWFYKRDNCKDFYGNIGRETDVQGYSQGYCGAVWSEPEYVLLSFP